MPTTKHWTTEIDTEINIKSTLSGPASVPPNTVCEVLKRVTRQFPHKPALRVKRNGEWLTWTWKEYYRDIASAAKSMVRIGVEPFHGVCVIGFNAPEWFIAYLGGIMAGGIGCGIYTTNNPDACHYVAENCSANIIFAENKIQVAKILQVRDRLPHLKMIVQYSSEPVDPEQLDQGVLPWVDFLDIGKDVPDYEVQWRIERQKPGNCAALIYTSGTTGPPKGVMVSHDNLTWTAAVCSSLFGLETEDHMISYLPLSHIAAQMLDVHAPLHSGLTVHFAQPDALKGSLLKTLQEVRPTTFVGVPRVWEKFKDKIEEQLRHASGIKEVVLEKARGVGRQTSLNRQSGKPVSWGYWLANAFIFKGLREKMGLERCRVAATAAAPISRSVLDFFLDFDFPLYELYGMSESSGPQTLSLLGSHKTGSTGKVMAGAEMKIDNPNSIGNGEICFRGRHVFMGYLNEERKTREAIDDDGWLHSGDIGRMDKDGYLWITGRIKELLITRGGENIAPVPIEEKMLDQMKLLNNCMVVGDDQRFLTMLVTLRTEVDSDLLSTNKLDALALSILSDFGSTSTTTDEAAEDPIVIEYINNGMARANQESVSRAAKVQKFRIVPLDFSVSEGELTPTLKLKRKFVLEKYSQLVKEMYD